MTTKIPPPIRKTIQRMPRSKLLESIELLDEFFGFSRRLPSFGTRTLRRLVTVRFGRYYDTMSEQHYYE